MNENDKLLIEDMHIEALELSNSLHALSRLDWDHGLEVLRMLTHHHGVMRTGNFLYSAYLDDFKKMEPEDGSFAGQLIEFWPDGTVFLAVNREALDLALHFFHLGARTTVEQHKAEVREFGSVYFGDDDHVEGWNLSD